MHGSAQKLHLGVQFVWTAEFLLGVNWLYLPDDQLSSTCFFYSRFLPALGHTVHILTPYSMKIRK